MPATSPLSTSMRRNSTWMRAFCASAITSPATSRYEDGSVRLFDDFQPGHQQRRVAATLRLDAPRPGHLHATVERLLCRFEQIVLEAARDLLKLISVAQDEG